MKGRTGFILFIAVFLLLIYWVEVSKPKSFDWRVTYSLKAVSLSVASSSTR